MRMWLGGPSILNGPIRPRVSFDLRELLRFGRNGHRPTWRQIVLSLLLALIVMAAGSLVGALVAALWKAHSG